MTTQNDGNSTTPLTTQTKKSGIRTVLRYTGIPPSWLDKRPRLPSRNWLIFLSVTSSILGLYIYDRRESKRIRQSYIEKVKDLAAEPTSPLEWPRRVTVYGSKWPGDEDYDQSLKYFRRYVKPILVAAAIDYEMVPGKRHGDIANRIANDIRLRRRLDLGLDQESQITLTLPTYKPPSEKRRHELDGGIIIIGRPTFKEFMAGLKKGWTEGLRQVDQDEVLSRLLEDDGHFDEPEEIDEPDGDLSSNSPNYQTKPVPLTPTLSPPHLRSFSLKPSQPSPKTDISDAEDLPPAIIPELPPLLLVPFTNYIGIKQIPLMIWDFFNQRQKVRSGAEVGYHLVMKISRPINVPLDVMDMASHNQDRTPRTGNGDLDFDKDAEGYYNKTSASIPDDIEKARKKYYDSLPEKLVVARQLARGLREPTKEETLNPPPTEVELRAERMKKERRWRNDLEGWDIVKPSSQVAWDERLRNSLHVFVNPPADEAFDYIKTTKDSAQS